MPRFAQSAAPPPHLPLQCRGTVVTRVQPWIVSVSIVPEYLLTCLVTTKQRPWRSPESSQCRHQISPTRYNCWLIAVGSWYEPEDFLFLWSGRLVRSASEVHCTAGVCTAHRSRAGRGKKRNSEHKFHVPMSSSGGKNKVSVVGCACEWTKCWNIVKKYNELQLKCVIT